MMKAKTAFLLTGAIAFSALIGAFNPNMQTCAYAQEATAAEEVALTADNTSLFLPETYEQYLSLESPSHVAFSDEYIAVADGATLYLYNRAARSYSQYEHKTGLEQSPTLLSELQFTDDGRLYFTDQRTTLYSFDLETKQAERQAISCSTFLFVEDTLYYATTTSNNLVTFYYVPIDDINVQPDKSRPVNRTELRGFSPHLAYENGTLHCIFNDNPRITFNTQTHEIISDNERLNEHASIISGLRYVCAFGGELYYTVNITGAGSGNGLYRAGTAEPILADDDLSTLAVHDKKLYCIKDASVLEVALSEGKAFFSGYEIAAASSSYNRFSGAADTVRAGNLLVTADRGNDRVSVYNFKSGEFSSFALQNAHLVATDGEIIAATDGQRIAAVSYRDVLNNNAEAAEYYDVRQGTVAGLVCLFGKVYFVTENSAYGQFGTDEPVFYSSYGTPSGMTCDLYGKIYVSYQNGDVYAFEESFFTVKDNAEKLSVALPQNHTSFRSDFEGNLYCLSDHALYKNGERIAVLPESEPFVYRGQTAPVSFALGFEDDGVYLCFGDYAVVSDEGVLDIPTLDKIPFGAAKEALFRTNENEDILVTVADQSVGIRVDLALMKEAEACFPYAGYARKDGANGVKLAQTEQYDLVLIGKDGDYEALLFRKESVAPVAREDYYAQSEGTFYLSNAVGAAYHPCMSAPLVRLRTERGLKVEQTAVLSMPDRDYALVVYESEGETITAYVPLCYLSEVAPLGTAHESYTLGYLKKGETEFFDEAGNALTVTERTRVRLYKTQDGYLAQFEKDGTLYSAAVAENMVENGANDALRISLIVILSVLAVLIVGVYLYLLPLRKHNAN